MVQKLNESNEVIVSLHSDSAFVISSHNLPDSITTWVVTAVSISDDYGECAQIHKLDLFSIQKKHVFMFQICCTDFLKVKNDSYSKLQM